MRFDLGQPRTSSEQVRTQDAEQLTRSSGYHHLLASAIDCPRLAAFIPFPCCNQLTACFGGLGAQIDTIFAASTAHGRCRSKGQLPQVPKYTSFRLWLHVIAHSEEIGEQVQASPWQGQILGERVVQARSPVRASVSCVSCVETTVIHSVNQLKSPSLLWATERGSGASNTHDMHIPSILITLMHLKPTLMVHVQNYQQLLIHL